MEKRCDGSYEQGPEDYEWCEPSWQSHTLTVLGVRPAGTRET